MSGVEFRKPGATVPISENERDRETASRCHLPAMNVRYPALRKVCPHVGTSAARSAGSAFSALKGDSPVCSIVRLATHTAPVHDPEWKQCVKCVPPLTSRS